MRALHGNITNSHTDDHATLGNQHGLIVREHRKATNNFATPTPHLHAGHPLAATMFRVKRVKRGPFAKALAGNQQQLVVVSGYRTRHNLVAFFEFHAPNSRRHPTHLSDLVGMETHDPTILSHQTHINFTIDRNHSDQLVVFAHLDGS